MCLTTVAGYECVMTGLKKDIFDALLACGSVYEVGGCVRDSLFGRDVSEKDRDYLVTGIPIDELIALLGRFGRVDIVGKSFGVIKFTPRGDGASPAATYDIALPRREFSTGIAHRDFEVDFDHTIPVEEDLLRRDFTINAVARDMKTGALIDPVDGQRDITKRTLRMISPISFTDDPLRILRGIQFAARCDLTIEAETMRAMREHADLIRTVTPERISEELNKLLVRVKKPSTGFLLMQEIGLLKLILPELHESVGVAQPGGYHAHNVFEHALYTVDAAIPTLRLRWAALLHDVTKPQSLREVEGGVTFYGHETSGARVAKKVLGRLRYPNNFVAEVATLIDQHMFSIPPTDKGLRRLVRRTGIDLIFDLLDLRRADVVGQGMGNKTDDVDEFERRIKDELDRKPPFAVKDLAIGGADLMMLFNIPESPIIGDILAHLLEIVLDDPEKNREDILVEAVKEYLHSEETR